MTRQEEYEAALKQLRHEAAARHREAQALARQARQNPELREPAPVIRDELDAAFAALRTREARP